MSNAISSIIFIYLYNQLVHEADKKTTNEGRKNNKKYTVAK